jgi:hypothetical protein
MKSKPLDQVHVNLSVPESVRVAWKIEAAKRRIEVNALVMEVMDKHLNK